MTRQCVLYAMVLCFGCSEPQDLDYLDELVDGGADGGGGQHSAQGAVSGAAADGAVDGGLDGGLDGAVVTAPCADAAGGGELCSVGKGACERAGTYVCTEGSLLCSVEPGMPTKELCGTDRDEDCDGEVDEAPEGGCCRHEDCAELELCSRPEGDALAAGACTSFERSNADCVRSGDDVSCVCREGYEDDEGSCVRNACVPLAGEAAPCAPNQSCETTGPGEKACACAAGFDDCDKVNSNGCEQAIATVAHCGACGKKCDARASCLTGTETRCACNRPLIGDGSSCLGFGPIGVGGAGSEVTCGIRATGSIECFPAGAPAPPSGAFKQLALGAIHHCALKADGSVQCWGNSDSGAHNVPTDPPNKDYVQVVVGNQHTCALKNDGTPVCWGISQVNPGSLYDHGQSNPPQETFHQLAAGGYHACGLRTDGSVRCWGAGITKDDDCSISYDCGQGVAPDERFIQITAGGYHSCGLRANGTVVCWGAGGTKGESSSPNQGQLIVPSDTHFTFVSAGAYHTCGVRTDNEVACWGAGSQSTSVFPVDFQQAVAPAGKFVRVAAGAFHTCGLTNLNQLRCWGGVTPANLPQTGTAGTWPVNP